MQILIRSNDIIYLTWVKIILSHNNIEFFVLDESMASTEGNISAIPIRILVDDDDLKKAKYLISQTENNNKN
jgi:NADH:ubiquinone oxidoreductase subunit K